MAGNNSTKDSLPTMPICIVVVGMSGNGKTTFVQKFIQICKQFKPFTINLDPACVSTPYFANIDIRDTVKYKQLMKQYKLGPNGAVLTALELMAMQIDKVVELVRGAGERGYKWCIIDTPGQIELFTTSATGSIITEALAAVFPTILIYVMDVVRSKNRVIFVSNILNALSIMYTGLPFILALNKIDIQDHSYAIDWISKFETFQDSLESDQSLIANLALTLSLTVDTFANDLKMCAVSAKTGIGYAQLFDMIAAAAIEHESGYKREHKMLCEEKVAKESAEEDED